MDFNLTTYQSIIQQLFNSYIEFLGETNDIQLETIIDTQNHHYLLVEVGWQNGRRIYGTLLHIDIIDHKLWIQQDGTEEGIADELVALGIPKQQIVLGFKPSDRRKVTEFAIS
jgi:XisI protein